VMRKTRLSQEKNRGKFRPLEGGGEGFSVLMGGGQGAVSFNQRKHGVIVESNRRGKELISRGEICGLV